MQEGAAALAWRWALLLAGEGQAPLNGCRLEGLEGVLGEGVLVPPAQALEQAHHPLGDGAQQGLHLLIVRRGQVKEGGLLLAPLWWRSEKPLGHEHVGMRRGKDNVHWRKGTWGSTRSTR